MWWAVFMWNCEPKRKSERAVRVHVHAVQCPVKAVPVAGFATLRIFGEKFSIFRDPRVIRSINVHEKQSLGVAPLTHAINRAVFVTFLTISVCVAVGKVPERFDITDKREGCCDVASSVCVGWECETKLSICPRYYASIDEPTNDGRHVGASRRQR